MSANTCLITGASRGIGLATALRFARRGYNVAGVARNAAALQEAGRAIRELGRWLPIAADLRESRAARECVEAVMKEFGGLDVVVNNAGVAPLVSIAEMTDEQFEECVELNCGAMFRMTRAAWGRLTGRGGTIVNVSSVASIDPFPGFAVYGACKAWVNTFTKACADEGRAAGIRVMGVAPGAVETEMLRRHFPTLPREQTLDPDDVAAVIEAVSIEPFQHASGQVVFVRR